MKRVLAVSFALLVGGCALKPGGDCTIGDLPCPFDAATGASTGDGGDDGGARPDGGIPVDMASSPDLLAAGG